jgi:hypothetical protein
MKPLYIIILIALVGCLYSCRSKKVAETAPEVVQEVIQVDTTIIPSFPSEVLYVVSREYESVWDSTTDKYNTVEAEYIRENNVSIKEYMERRLISLFPNMAYIGLLDKIEGRAKDLIPEKTRRTPSFRSQDGYYMPAFAEKVNLEKVSDNYEINHLLMSYSELQLYNRLNALADTSHFVSLKQVSDIQVKDSLWNVDKKLSEDSVPSYMKESLLISFLTSGVASLSIIILALSSKLSVCNILLADLSLMSLVLLYLLNSSKLYIFKLYIASPIAGIHSV